MSLLSFAKLVSPQSGPQPIKMLLLVAVLVSGQLFTSFSESFDWDGLREWSSHRGVEVSPTFLWFWAEGDPEKLSLTDKLLTSVLCEATLHCSGQPVEFV